MKKTLNDLLQDPDEWLDVEDNDDLLVTIIHSDCQYQILIGHDDDGYYLCLEDEEHCEYRYDGEDGKSLTEIYEDLFNIARNKEAF